MERTTDHNIMRTLALTVFLSCAYFWPGGGFNQNARFDALFAVVRNHTLAIDSLHDNTGDVAEFEGHYYSDKAPGLVFLSVPIAAVLRVVFGLFGADLNTCIGFATMAYLATLGSSGLAAAWISVLLFLVIRRLDGSQAAAVVGAVVGTLGCPMWAYATLFWGHALVAALLVTGFYTSLLIVEKKTTSLKLWVLLGVSGGFATLTSYTALIPAVYLVFLALRNSGLRGTKALAAFGACGAAASIALVFLLAHNTLIFHSPFVLGYSHTEGWDGMKSGFFGLHLPDAEVALKVLFGSERGLFRIAPVLLLGAGGLLLGTHQGGRLALAGHFGLFVCSYYLILNASYVYWNGGYTFGPRHMGEALPFYALGVAIAFMRASSSWVKVSIVCVACVGVVTALMAVAVGTPDGNTLVPWKQFLSGEIPSPQGTIFPKGLACASINGIWAHTSWNLGYFFGLEKLLSLLPLVGIWSMAALYIIRCAKRHRL